MSAAPEPSREAADPAGRLRVGAAMVAWVQAAGLLAVAVSALVTSAHTTGWTSDVPRSRMTVSEVVLYVLFAALVAWLGWRVRLGHGRVWTPFALVQVFSIVAAWPMVKSDVRGYLWMGLLVLLSGVVGLVTASLWWRRDPSAVTG